jgi:hypothetical protein
MIMTTHNRTVSRSLFLLILLPVASVAAQQEGIAFDPQSGNYIISYEHEGRLLQAIYEPPNKINPVLKSAFRLTPSGDIVYRYRLKNAKDVRQSIVSFAMLVTSARGATISTNAPEYLMQHPTAEAALALSADSRKVILSTPSRWEGKVLPNPRRTGLDIWWSEKSMQGLSPGESQGGFGYESQDLPGIGLAGVRGRAPTLAFKGEGPGGEVDRQLNAIMRETSGVTRPAAIPTFSVPAPFNSSVLLIGLQKHAKVDLVEFKLLDPTLAARLDPWFTAAIDSAKRSNNEGTRHATFSGRNARIWIKMKRGEIGSSETTKIRKSYVWAASTNSPPGYWTSICAISRVGSRVRATTIDKVDSNYRGTIRRGFPRGVFIVVSPTSER